jgi:histidyl-tRNA synthetase
MEESLLTNIPGMRDLLPEEVAVWQLVEDHARRIYAQYGFQEIRTPIVEATELFARSIGGDTDIVGKEMYTFADQSGKSISLRPEATVSVVRAYVQHSMHRDSPLTKLYYIGPMFRHEKKQKGRWRQFYQIGAEVLGSDHPAIEAEVIEMLIRFFAALGVQSRLLVNSVGCGNCRPPFVHRLREALHQRAALLCEDCRRRTELNPLRVLDCKVETCQPHINSLPMITQHLCGNCESHFERFRTYLVAADIAFEVMPRLVRGLDYYVRTAFEIVSGDLGAQNALAGGGRYDGLSEVLGGPPVHGFGFALGQDRLMMVLSDQWGKNAVWRPELFVISMGEEAFNKGLSIARLLRAQGIGCYVDFEGGSIKSQMRLANKIRARHVLLIGENELIREQYQIKRMQDSKQWGVTLSELRSYLLGEQLRAKNETTPMPLANESNPSQHP